MVILRSNDTIELYEVVMQKEIVKVCDYQLSSGVKISKMIAVKKPGTKIEMLVIQVDKLKFDTLEFDSSTFEFRIVCLHNFENDHRLRMTGKVNARFGFLQPFYMEGSPIVDDFKIHHEGRGRPRKERTYETSEEMYSPILNQLKQA